MTQYITLPKQAKDITGQRYGRLVVLGPVGRAGNHIKWLCLCDCGNTAHALGFNMHTGSTTSCGCYRADRVTTADGHTAHPLYRIWKAMLQRCNEPTCGGYEHYGARGIRVWEEWSQSFVAFKHFVETLPNYGHKGVSIDRINNNGNYEPSNVRWSTRVEQAQNTSRNKYLTYNGKSQCQQSWAKEYGIHSSTLAGRLQRGWDMERALTAPVDATHNHLKQRTSID